MRSNSKQSFVSSLLNKLKISVDCKLDKIGVTKLFKDSNVKVELINDDTSGELELRLNIGQVKPNAVADDDKASE